MKVAGSPFILNTEADWKLLETLRSAIYQYLRCSTFIIMNKSLTDDTFLSHICISEHSIYRDRKISTYVRTHIYKGIVYICQIFKIYNHRK